MRFRTICVALALALAVLAGGQAVSARPNAHRATPIAITVIGKEFSFTFSRSKVPHGSTVVFRFINRGQVDHNLVFTTLKKQTPMIGPGKHATLRIAFPKVGRYYYICSVPFHAQSGMTGVFIVT